MPFHPALVHYPIALLVQSTIFQGLYLIIRQNWLIKASLISWLLALIGAIIAALTGTAQVEAVLALGTVEELLALHERSANLTIFVSLAGLLYAFVSFKHNKLNPWVHFAILLLLSALVLVTGHYGGRLVFLHGAGITPQ